jgi:predicted TIM-barrel fold metal-dependent hydrolase
LRQFPLIGAHAERSGAAAAPRPELPPGACDCHVHLFGAPQRYPFAAARAYTPGLAEVADARALMQSLSLARLVLVQPSAYDVDNTCLLDGLAALGDRARGIAVVAPDAGDAELSALHAAGVRGLRLNLGGPEDDIGTGDLAAALRAAAAPLAGSGWLLQLHAPAAALLQAGEALRNLPLPLIVDHFANIPAAALPGHPACVLVESLLAGGRTWLKLSAPYRIARTPEETARLRGWVEVLAARWPDRLLWGSDWPHTPPHGPGVTRERSIGFREVDAAADLSELLTWLGNDAELCEQILSQNPEKLFGFAVA